MDSRRAIYRIIDANLNRASEGLRVIEDGVRFALDDRSLTEELKELRHSLAKIVEETPVFSREELISSRNSQKDVGAQLAEEKREEIKEMIRANFKRVEEAESNLPNSSRLLSASSTLLKLALSISLISSLFSSVSCAPTSF